MIKLQRDLPSPVDPDPTTQPGFCRLASWWVESRDEMARKSSYIAIFWRRNLCHLCQTSYCQTNMDNVEFMWGYPDKPMLRGHLSGFEPHKPRCVANMITPPCCSSSILYVWSKLGSPQMGRFTMFTFLKTATKCWITWEPIGRFMYNKN
jgi:hypothetical protein